MIEVLNTPTSEELESLVDGVQVESLGAVALQEDLSILEPTEVYAADQKISSETGAAVVPKGSAAFCSALTSAGVVR